MNKHLELVRQFRASCSFPQVQQGANPHLSDMDIVLHQAALMEQGGVILKAIKAGDMVEILAGLVNLAYAALTAIAARGDDVVEHPVTWRHDGFVVSIMRILSDKINQCTSGNTDDYSEVYGLCAHLARSFINADFDKAFHMIHHGKMSSPAKAPDLSECLYE